MENQKENKKEIRSLPDELAEVRIVGDSRNVEGYGIVFNRKSQDLGGFKEVIKPEAVDGVIEKSDILCLLNHSRERGVLARSTNGKGTLKIDVDQKGVRYAFEAPKFPLGDEVLEGVKRKDIKGSSFAFWVAEGGDAWDKQPDGSYLRTINRFEELFDISPVYTGAYKDASVALRSLEQAKAKEEKEEIREPDEETEAKPVVEETTEPIVKDKPSRAERYIKQLNKSINQKF